MYINDEKYGKTMIVFLIGFMALIFGVAGIEGTLPIFLGILISILGGSMMLWGIKIMANKDQLQ